MTATAEPSRSYRKPVIITAIVLLLLVVAAAFIPKSESGIHAEYLNPGDRYDVLEATYDADADAWSIIYTDESGDAQTFEANGTHVSVLDSEAESTVEFSLMRSYTVVTTWIGRSYEANTVIEPINATLRLAEADLPEGF